MEGKGPQNKTKRLEEGYYEGETDGQNHDRNYSAGRRRLGELDRENVEGLVTRTKDNGALI